MVFCIDPDKGEKLADIISTVLATLKDDEGVEALIMNSHIIHIPVASLFEPSPVIDGLNIQLTIVVNDDRMYVDETLRAIKSACLEELNYNILYAIIGKNILKAKSDSLKTLLNDGEVLFDKTGEATQIKACVFKNKSEESVTYQPALNIRG